MLLLMRKLRFLFLFLTTLLFCLITAINAEAGLPEATNFIFGILFVTSIFVIGEHEEKLFLGLIAIGTIQLVQIALGIWITHMALAGLKAFVGMVFFVVLAVACLRLTLQDKTISITTLFGSLSAYLFIGLAFAYLYLSIYAFYPASFIGLKPYEEVRAIYFSFITLTTVGFGDVLPVTPVVQTLTWIESFSGQAYMAVFISQLVGRYVAKDMQA